MALAHIVRSWTSHDGISLFRLVCHIKRHIEFVERLILWCKAVGECGEAYFRLAALDCLHQGFPGLFKP